jgi:hypothetical protein
MSETLKTWRTSAFWRARERSTTDDHADREQMLHRVLEQMPPQFSAFEFLDVAIGLNAINNAGEVDRYLQHLGREGELRRSGSLYFRAT